jgi:cytoskeletal protein CcmA (bactofilin family)
MNSTNHFDEMACLLYLEGQLDEARSREFVAHTAECSACRDLLRALTRETNLLSAALAEDTESMPARLLAGVERRLPPWAWTLAFGVFAAGAYALWTDGISPWLNQFTNAGFGGTDLFSIILFSGAFWEGWGDMIDALQVGALVVVGLVALGWIRRRLRRSAAIAGVVSALLFAMALPQQAAAADVRRARSEIVVPAGETVHNDLIAMGPAVRIDGTVDGDVIAFTRSLIVSGHVTGDVIGFAGETLINGTVDGNLRVGTHSVTLQGTIGKNVSAASNSIDLASKGSIGGGLIAMAAQMDLDGKVTRDLLGMVGRSELEGSIGGQTWIRGGALTVASTADLRGPATFVGPQEPTVDAGAKLASPIHTEIEQEVRRGRRSAGARALRSIFAYGAALLVGLLVILVLPGFFRATLRETDGIGLPIGIGALALISGAFLVVLAILLLFLGAGAGVAGVMAYVPILYLSQVFVGAWLGNKILRQPANNTSAVIGRLALGLLILRIVGLIPVLGVLMWIVVVLWGTGAMLMAFYRMSRSEATPLPA